MSTVERPEHRESPRETEGATRETCRECDGELRYENTETFCPDCGLVHDISKIDHGPEWRPFEHDTRARTGPPRTVTRHDRGLSTEIGWEHVASGRKRHQLNRLRREHGRAKFTSKAERNLAHGFGDIKRMSAALELSNDAVDRACAIFREAQQTRLLHGRSVESMATASLYAACRCLGLPRTLEELDAFAPVDVDRIRSAFRVLNRELALPTKPVGPAQFVPKLASATEAEDPVRFRALELVSCAESRGLVNGRTPAGVAAACLYGAAIETGYQVTPTGTLTQQVIADHAGVSTATVRSNWQALREHCDEIDG